jgi:hypothetical protein
MRCQKLRSFESLRCLSAHAAMCALGIEKLRQHPTEILLLRRHAEQNALGAHVPVKSLHVGNRKAQFDFSCRIFIGSRVHCEYVAYTMGITCSARRSICASSSNTGLRSTWLTPAIFRRLISSAICCGEPHTAT